MCSSQEEETLTTTTATATKTSLKKWIRAASNFIALIPSISFNSPKVGKVFWSWILEDCIKVQEKKKKVLPCVPVLDKTWNYRLRNVQKKCDAHAKLLFCKYNLSHFCRSRCRRGHRCFKLLNIMQGSRLGASKWNERKPWVFWAKQVPSHNFVRSKKMWVKPMTVLA